jgi:hypothetical protein
MLTTVILSTMVDYTIAEEQRGVKFLIFNSLETLTQYIENTPIRANNLFITKEIMQRVNTSLTYLLSALQSPFFNVDNVVYITTQMSPELRSVRYIIDERKLSNWEIEDKASTLTREYVTGIITGLLRQDSNSVVRKAVYRVPRSEFVNNTLRSRNELQDRYVDDDADISGVLTVPTEPQILSSKPHEEQSFLIIGLPTLERSIFTFITAQYLSLQGKTIVIEHDWRYHTLSDIVAKSKIDCLNIDVEDIFLNCKDVFKQIQFTEKRLICITTKRKTTISTMFIYSLLLYNLIDIIFAYVIEGDIKDMPLFEKCICVVSLSAPDVLKLCENIRGSIPRFVGVCRNDFQELQLLNSKSVSVLLSDLLNTKIPDVQIVQCSSMFLDGNTDLRSILNAN